MTEDTDQARRDLAFLRSLAEDGRPTLRALGALMLVSGLIQAVSALRLWAVDTGWLGWPDALRAYLGIDGVILQLAIMILLPKLDPSLTLRPGSASPAGRAIRGAMNALAWALAAAVLGLIAARWQMQDGQILSVGFPIVLFALAAATWQVAYAVNRRRWAQLAALASVLFAIAMGSVAGGSTAILALAAGFVSCFAIPGAAMMRQAHREV
ncbi:MAG: hypothetical protein J7498_13250 [Sphingobium sp.]|nr:hypothetical protein [Sphingobium sp.]